MSNDKFQRWYDQQNETTKQNIDNTPVWEDSHLCFAFVSGLLGGIILGLIL